MSAEGSSPPDAFRDFWQGLTATTRGSFYGVAAFCLAELAAVCWLTEPPRLGKLDPRWLMESPQDEYCALSLRLMQLRHSELEGLQVSYIGPSQATRALASREDHFITTELRKASGLPVTFHVFSTNNQRMEDAVEISDMFPPSYRGVLVMLVHDGKDDFSKYRAPGKLREMRERIAVPPSPDLLALWKQHGNYTPRHTGVFFLDHLEFFVSRRFAGVRFQKVPGPLQTFVGTVDPAHYRQAMGQLERAIEHPETDRDLERRQHERAPLLTSSRPAMERLLANMKARGVLTVFVQSPQNPLRAELYAERLNAFRDELTKFAADRGALYWDFNDDMDLKPEDFQDTIHLGTQRARRQFQNLLVAKLAELLHERFASGG